MRYAVDSCDRWRIACMMLKMRRRAWCGDGMRCRASALGPRHDADALAMWQRISPSHFHVSLSRYHPLVHWTLHLFFTAFYPFSISTFKSYGKNLGKIRFIGFISPRTSYFRGRWTTSPNQAINPANGYTTWPVHASL
jgi:hypothetical protein